MERLGNSIDLRFFFKILHFFFFTNNFYINIEIILKIGRGNNVSRKSLISLHSEKLSLDNALSLKCLYYEDSCKL